MAYKSTRQKREDPNAESRLKPPPVIPIVPPSPPYIPNPAGGAPRVNPTPKPTVGPGGENPGSIGVVPGPPAVVGPGGQNPSATRPAPTRGSGPYLPTTPFTPVAEPTPMWRNQPSIAKPASSLVASNWSLKAVAAAEPEVTKQIQDMLWQKFQTASEQERNGIFWQGVKQNPQLAAASFVRRMLDNMKNANDLMNGTTPPTLSAAASATSANSETRQWLDWVRGNRRFMPRKVV